MTKQLTEGSDINLPTDMGYRTVFVSDECGDTMWDEVLAQTEDRGSEAEGKMGAEVVDLPR